jgi:hypothetical protein
MAEKESLNDSISVESGSCDCCNYTSDISWFYDSSKLKETHSSFSLLKDKNNIKINLNKNPNINAQKNVYIRSRYRIALNNIKNKSIEQNLNEDNNQITKDEKEKDKKDEVLNISNKKENGSNTAKPIRYKIFNMKPIMDDKSKRINLFRRFKNININNAKKEDDNKNTDMLLNQDKKNQPESKNYGFKFRNYNLSHESKTVKNEENNKNINSNKPEQNNNENTNNQIRTKTLTEKIVNETKNIALEPGQKIKPKTVTTRKLKPIIETITNEDGTQFIRTETTTLITTTINEILDQNQVYNDDYTLDVQLVKQHISKKYVTEIENNPITSNKKFP